MDINQDGGAGHYDPDNKLPTDKAGLLTYWKEQIRLGIKYRQVYGRDREWRTYKNAYRSYFAPQIVPVNIIYAVGRSLIPQVYYRNPRITIMGSKPGLTLQAKVLERVDNYLIKEMNIKDTMKSMILDTYLCGRGFGIFGYDSEFGFNPSYAANETDGESSLTQFGDKGNRIEYNYNVTPGAPWFLRCNPTDFIVPWGTYDWNSAPWYAFRKVRPLRDVLEDPKYINTNGLKGVFKSQIEPQEEGSSIQNATNNSSQNVGTNALVTEFVELWEIHDQRSGFVYVVTLDHTKFLRADFDELQIEGLNAMSIGFNEDPDYFWWTPDCRLIMPQQYEINDIRTMAKAHRRVALLKVLYDKGLVGKEALEKLLDGDPKAAVPIDVGPSGDIRKAVTLLQSHVPPDLSIAAREAREDVREMVGFSRNQMGSFEESSGRRTAYEAALVRAASMIRIDERRDIMTDALEMVMRKTNQTIFKNWTSERVIDIVGPDGARYWVRFNGRQIKGEFNYSIRPEEALPSSQATMREDARGLLEIAAKIPGADIQYLLHAYAGTFDWVDPNLMFPGQGPGRSPERALPIEALQKQLTAQAGNGTNQFSSALAQ